MSKNVEQWIDEAAKEAAINLINRVPDVHAIYLEELIQNIKLGIAAHAPDVAELVRAARNMMREWIEAMGDELQNGTPADTLEKMRAALAKFPAPTGFPPPTMLRFLTCTRERTRGNVYDYSYWKCGTCGYHPGEEQGPPNHRCLNCGNIQYTEDPREATMLIRLLKTSLGFRFEIVQSFKEGK